MFRFQDGNPRVSDRRPQPSSHGPWPRADEPGRSSTLVSITSFLQNSPFPPTTALPPVHAADLPILQQAAKGEPGQTVWPGLFPRPAAKLARLLLAAQGLFDAATLRSLATTRYGGDPRPGPPASRRYDAHDAFACALVHPHHDAAARAALVTTVLLPSVTSRRRGWRSRRKSWAVARWAVQTGHVDATLLPRAIVDRLALPPSGQPLLLPFLPSPRGHAGALACFAACWPRFRTHLAREQQADTWLDYVGIAELGHRHFAAFASGCPAPWVQGVFDAIEHVLTVGDDAAQNLVVVGLFEAVQGDAYRTIPAGDRYEARLGPNSQKAWADLIEGWTGQGIRTLSTWRTKPKP